MPFERVVLLVVDSLCPTDITLEATPCIAKLRDQGISCRHTYSQGNPTQFAYPAILTSTLPLDYGGYDEGIANRPRTLAECFQRHNYHTLGISTTDWLSSFYGYHRGFDELHALHYPPGGWQGGFDLYFTYHRELHERGDISDKEYHEWTTRFLDRTLRYMLAHAREDFAAAEEIPRGCPAKFSRQPGHAQLLEALENIWDAFSAAPDQFTAKHGPHFHSKKHRSLLGIELLSPDTTLLDATIVFQLLAERLRESPRNCFAWAHVRDVHDWRKLLATKPLSEGEARRMAVRHVDRALSSFLETLTNEEMIAETLIVLLADHGAAPPTSQSRRSLHVPLVLWSPRLESSAIDSICGVMDIGPSLLDLQGWEPEPGFDGESIWNSAERRHVLAEGAGHGPCDLKRKHVSVAATDGELIIRYDERNSRFEVHEETVTGTSDREQTASARVERLQAAVLDRVRTIRGNSPRK